MVNKLHLYIIPHKDNQHRPHLLRPRMLSIISIFVLTAKIFVTAVFLFSYNSPEVFAEISSRKLVELTNQSRTTAGVNPVKENALLTRAAYQKAQDMLDRNYFNHEDPDGNMPWYWLKNNNYIYSYAGENLAMDFTRAETVHEAWLSSESHRANIENPNYKEIGIAVVHGKLNGKSTTVLVEFFGTTFIPSIAGEPDVLYSETAGNPLSTEVLADGNNPQLKSAEVTAELKGIENKGFLSSLSSYSDKIYWALFLLLISALMVNIFVKIRIQHQPAIIQTIAVLLLIGSAIAVRTHFLENIPRLLQII
ncbi:MAG: CAP domain-containing protein [Patescibacteria group bacterium]